MPHWSLRLLFVLLAIAAWPQPSQDQCQGRLPSVLLIGDSVYHQLER